MTAGAWREERGPGWARDIGYRLQETLGRHSTTNYANRGSKPNDPGWHSCTCGWEGYWTDFHPHLADELRELVADPPPITEAAVRAALDYIEGLDIFPDHLYEPQHASAAVKADVDDRNMHDMRKVLEAAQRAQLGFLVPELP